MRGVDQQVISRESALSVGRAVMEELRAVCPEDGGEVGAVGWGDDGI